MKTFKETGFYIDFKTNVKVKDFLDITLKLRKGMYPPFKIKKIK